MQIPDEIWIFSVLEVKLCMNILGREDWDMFPVQQTNQNLQERLLDAFLHLADMGFLKKSAEGYDKTEKMKQFFLPFAEGKFIVQTLRKDRCPLIFAEDTDGVLVMELMSEQENAVRLYSLDTKGTEEMFASFVTGQHVPENYMELSETDRLHCMDTILRVHNGQNKTSAIYFIWSEETGAVMQSRDTKQMYPFDKETVWKVLEGADDDHSKCQICGNE